MTRGIASAGGLLILIVCLTAPPVAGGTSLEVQNGSLPVVSPDGAHIVFFSNRTGSDDMFVTKADGSKTVQLTHTPDVEHFAGWAADSRRIAYSIYQKESSSIYTIAIDRTDQRLVATVAGRSPLLSPDGKRIVFAKGSWTEMELLVADVDGSNAKQINDGKSIAWNCRWSPDGMKIAFTGRGTPQSELAVFIVDSDGGNRRQVTQISTEEGGAQGPSWSKDGRRLAIQVNSRINNGSAHLWIVDIASGASRKLAVHKEPYLDETESWFPDGHHLAFQSNRTGRMEIWVINVDHGDARQITR